MSSGLSAVIEDVEKNLRFAVDQIGTKATAISLFPELTQRLAAE